MGSLQSPAQFWGLGTGDWELTSPPRTEITPRPSTRFVTASFRTRPSNTQSRPSSNRTPSRTTSTGFISQ